MVWITCGLWCFYQLFGLSFWRHPFTAEEPFVSKLYNATLLQICFAKETNLSTSRMAWGWVNLNFGVNYFFNRNEMQLNYYTNWGKYWICKWPKSPTVQPGRSYFQLVTYWRLARILCILFNAQDTPLALLSVVCLLCQIKKCMHHIKSQCM